MLRKTKIICTIGPASEDISMLKTLMRNGMDVARLNFSHGSHEEHEQRILGIRKASEEEGKNIAILLDTKGPEIRTGDLKESEATLVAGEKIILTSKPILGDEKRISVSYEGLPQDVNPGSTILIDDGLIGLKVDRVEGTEIYCTIKNGGVIKSRKGVNIPGVKINLPGITKKDEEDIIFGIRHGADFIAASFVRKPQDVLEIRKILEEYQTNIPIISKIENQEGIKNLDSILEVSDGLMIARGDLGVEIPAEDLPILQKEMIYKCNQLGKPVITATQMLDSMQRNPRPTRAETCDVANAILDGTDAIMLSGETAAGRYPAESVSTMARIAIRTEASLRYKERFQQKIREMSQTITESISQAVVQTSYTLECSAILTSTESGYTARMVSKYRPKTPIIAVTPNESTLKRLQLVWGVYPVKGADATTTDEMFTSAISTSLENNYVKQGDLVVITAGIPVGRSGKTNLMKVHVIGGVIAQGQGIGKKVVAGPVVVANSADELKRKMVDGAIIVTRGTDKEMAEWFNQAAAVITEEGGLTSHAAVVGVSLGIPIVVGVEDATKLLAAEKEVTVDTDTGHIYSGIAKIL
ncbi:pyruvate kinase [Thermoactinomyces mirandus]|uniref:Pyruvate kinase n=1 Tax=Thermoactinomyces mirandus TaxID=2756294 RepID=A0A7W1XQT5_9BACL|nr:pyruvate kinase [Thermoactinomyces mirandus]MBA4601599.1 pyruvate kinase [Thermoactinomyces mirandus]